MKEFFASKETKDLLARISALFGIKQSVIRQVWDYTLFEWFLEMSRDENNVKSIEIPYLGILTLKVDGERIDESSGEIVTDVASKMSLSKEFIKMLGKIQAEEESELAEYLKESYIDPIMKSILVEEE